MKLKLTISNETRTLHYEKGTVVIGSGGSHHADLVIPGLQPVHVRFVDQNGQYYAINEANDPFVSLNGLPFRKKIILDNDFLELAPKITLLIEDLGSAPVPTVETHIVAAPERKLKPIKINDLEEESEAVKPLPKGKIGGLGTTPFYKNFKMVFILAGMAIIFFTFIIGGLYTKATEHSLEEEIVAAEGISDIAMALMYAQVNHLKPKKHNWSDPDFIRNNLNAVITHDFPALSNIDSHGQFATTPYILRTYTNTDFSHFIVIAQPSPGMTQWLVPRTAIVIDSKLMQLRKIKDLRTLNRLLVNPTILDGEQAESVTALIKQGELIPMASLAARRTKQGFTPPKALALFYPGAENRIYNAPRYYQFGQSIVQRALRAEESNHHERIRLQQEMEILSLLPNMVLYSSNGMEVAMETQKRLTRIYPETKFISGYLKFNNKAHLISSNLLLDSDVALNPTAQEEREWSVGHYNPLLQTDSTPKKMKVRLQEMLAERRTALQPYLDKVVKAIGCCVNSSAPTSTVELDSAIAEYKEFSRKEDHKLRDKLGELYYETLPLPYDRFVNMLIETDMYYWIKPKK